jgi:hypothetical protein
VTKFPKKEILMAYVSSVFGAINPEKSRKKSEKYCKIQIKSNKPQNNPNKSRKFPKI